MFMGAQIFLIKLYAINIFSQDFISKPCKVVGTQIWWGPFFMYIYGWVHIQIQNFHVYSLINCFHVFGFNKLCKIFILSAIAYWLGHQGL